MENKSDYHTVDRVVKSNEIHSEAAVALSGFNPNDYPEVLEEVRILKARLLSVPSLHKVEIIISFFRDHSIRTAWVLANPELTKVVVSGVCKTSGLESLFEKFKNNKILLQHIKEYINERLK